MRDRDRERERERERKRKRERPTHPHPHIHTHPHTDSRDTRGIQHHVHIFAFACSLRQMSNLPILCLNGVFQPSNLLREGSDIRSDNTSSRTTSCVGEQGRACRGLGVGICPQRVNPCLMITTIASPDIASAGMTTFTCTRIQEASAGCVVRQTLEYNLFLAIVWEKKDSLHSPSCTDVRSVHINI